MAWVRSHRKASKKKLSSTSRKLKSTVALRTPRTPIRARSLMVSVVGTVQHIAHKAKEMHDHAISVGRERVAEYMSEQKRQKTVELVHARTQRPIRRAERDIEAAEMNGLEEDVLNIAHVMDNNAHARHAQEAKPKKNRAGSAKKRLSWRNGSNGNNESGDELGLTEVRSIPARGEDITFED
jgi:hypothetical protein